MKIKFATSRISKKDKMLLKIKYPSFPEVDHIDVHREDMKFLTFHGIDSTSVMTIAKQRPEFIEYVNPNKLDQYFLVQYCVTTSEMSSALNVVQTLDDLSTVHLDLLKRFPSLYSRFCTDQFSGFDWVRLLKIYPEAASDCKWDKLSGNDWIMLLRWRPEFESKCNWNRVKTGKLLPDAVIELIKHQPQYAHDYLIRQISHKSWNDVVSVQPQLASVKPAYYEMS